MECRWQPPAPYLSMHDPKLLVARRTTRTVAAIPARSRAGAAIAARWRTEFLRGEFAVAVSIEFLQIRARLGDFVFINRAIPVRIQGCHQRRNEAWAAGTAGTALSARPSAASFTRRTVRSVLRQAECAGQNTTSDNSLYFHSNKYDAARRHKVTPSTQRWIGNSKLGSAIVAHDIRAQAHAREGPQR